MPAVPLGKPLGTTCGICAQTPPLVTIATNSALHLHFLSPTAPTAPSATPRLSRHFSPASTVLIISATLYQEKE